jgi:uncharacterized protein
MVTLDVTPFAPGLHELTLEATPEELELDPDTFTDISVEVRLDHREDRTLVLLAPRATATLECDRTLEPFRQRVAGQHSVLFLAPEDFDRRAADPAEDDALRRLPEPGVPLDLTAPIRDTLLLALPSRRVAPGAEDRDIPLVFGAEPEDEGDLIDPRWEALRRLRDAS